MPCAAATETAPEVTTTTRWDGGGRVGCRSIAPTTAGNPLTSPAGDRIRCHTVDQGDFGARTRSAGLSTAVRNAIVTGHERHPAPPDLARASHRTRYNSAGARQCRGHGRL